MNPTKEFWQGKKVLVTGHTGFKGSWLCLWLNSMGVRVVGYALEPPTEPNLFTIAGVSRFLTSIHGDVRDRALLGACMAEYEPQIVFHLAAQPLVRESYKDPVATYETNVMGTVNLLESIRKCPSVKAVVNVTTDKVYENHEQPRGYKESEPFGGYDPYSNSKACSELVTAAFRSSFFNPQDYAHHGVGLATARAGNVIGGGDWAADRLIPDCVRSLLNSETILIRNPDAIRPWQHVLEPLCGYLILAEQLFKNGALFSEGWNFGPDNVDAKPVEQVVRLLCTQWGTAKEPQISSSPQVHEAGVLMLDCAKAKARLSWRPRWNLETAIDRIVYWTKQYAAQADGAALCTQQIKEYLES